MDKNTQSKNPSSQLTKTPFSKKSIGQWKKLLSSYFDNNKSTNPLTIPQFCKKHNVSTASFYKWRHELRPDSFIASPLMQVSSKGKFIAVKQVSQKKLATPIDSISSPIKISLPSDISLEFTKGCQLSELSKVISFLNAT